jgi:hypothetical protein
MRRHNVDALFRLGINPISFVSADWKYQCMDSSAAVYDAHFKIGVGWCNRHWQPFFG